MAGAAVLVALSCSKWGKGWASVLAVGGGDRVIGNLIFNMVRETVDQCVVTLRTRYLPKPVLIGQTV